MTYYKYINLITCPYVINVWDNNVAKRSREYKANAAPYLFDV